MTNEQDLTKGNVTKLILAFYFPMLLTNLLQQFYTFADQAIVGKGLGDNALASVGNMGTLTFFIIGFSIGIGNGFSVIIAQNYGAKDVKKVKKSLAAAVLLCIIIGLGLTIFSLLFLRKALVLIKTDSLILDDSFRYGSIIFGGLITAIAYNFSSAVLRALGDSKTPLKAIIISTIMNISLDCLFIFGLKSGVEGAAFSTVISQCFSAAVCIRKIISVDTLKLSRADFKNELNLYVLLLKNGIPMAFMNSLTAIGCMVVQYFVNGFGVIYTAAYSACSRYNNMFMQPACTLGFTISAYTSQNYGAREYKRIKAGLKVCSVIAGISYLLLGSIMYFAAAPLAGLLLTGEESIQIACQFLHICGITIVAVDFLFVFRSAVQGMGYPLIPMLSGFLEMTLRISTIIIFAKSIGFCATAYAETAAWTGALILNVIAFTYLYRKCVRQNE